MLDQDKQVWVRFTGTRPGSAKYTAPGTGKRGYAFGFNPTHVQQLMPLAHYESLKKLYAKDLLMIPDNLATANVPLHERITQCEALATEDRDAIFNLGVVTVGQAMAIGAGGLIRVFGNQAKADAVIAALQAHYLGGDPRQQVEALVERDDLTALPRVGAATAAALDVFGIKTFADVAAKLTLDQWLSLPGKTEHSYSIVTAAAKERVGGGA